MRNVVGILVERNSTSQNPRSRGVLELHIRRAMSTLGMQEGNVAFIYSDSVTEGENGPYAHGLHFPKMGEAPSAWTTSEQVTVPLDDVVALHTNDQFPSNTHTALRRLQRHVPTINRMVSVSVDGTIYPGISQALYDTLGTMPFDPEAKGKRSRLLVANGSPFARITISPDNKPHYRRVYPHEPAYKRAATLLSELSLRAHIPPKQIVFDMERTDRHSIITQVTVAPQRIYSSIAGGDQLLHQELIRREARVLARLAFSRQQAEAASKPAVDHPLLREIDSLLAEVERNEP